MAPPISNRDVAGQRHRVGARSPQRQPFSIVERSGLAEMPAVDTSVPSRTSRPSTSVKLGAAIADALATTGQRPDVNGTSMKKGPKLSLERTTCAQSGIQAIGESGGRLALRRAPPVQTSPNLRVDVTRCWAAACSSRTNSTRRDRSHGRAGTSAPRHPLLGEGWSHRAVQQQRPGLNHTLRIISPSGGP